MSESRSFGGPRSARLLLGTALVATVAACGGAPVVVATPAPPPASTESVTATPSVIAQPPAVPPQKPLTLPPIIRRELPNGLELLIVEHHELPVANFLLLVKSGYEEDPARTPGLVSLTASMLDEGAGRRNALAIASQQALLGANLGTGAGFDASTISLQTPTAQLDSALALFADVALRPTFPQGELDRLRAERLTLLTQLKDRGPAIADIVFPAVLYGREHPYGRPTLGTEQSVGGIARADLVRFYEAHYRPNNATLIVVGDVDPDAITQQVNRLFGAWQSRPVPASAAASALRAPAARVVHVVDKPGAAQSSVRVGAVGVARSTDDYFPIIVMNTVFGASFGSRLNQNLRERKGYTYGARSYFDMRAQPGPFAAVAEIVGEKTDSALVEFIRELTLIRDTVPADELAQAKRFLQTQLPGDFETPSDIASRLVPIALYGLPLDFYNNYSQRVEAVTQADVQRVAQRYVDPSKVAIVVVGDRAKIESGIRGLQIGDVVIRAVP